MKNTNAKAINGKQGTCNRCKKKAKVFLTEVGDTKCEKCIATRKQAIITN